MTARSPEPPRCGTCDRRLSRTEADHEEHCFRRAHGWPAFEYGDGASIEASTTEAAMAAMEAARAR